MRRASEGLNNSSIARILTAVAIGSVLGLIVGVGISGGLLVLLSVDPHSLPAVSPPAAYDIEVVVEETYINRIMVQSANEMDGAMSITAGRMDLRPGALAGFVVEIEVGPLRPVIEGTVGFRATEDGSSIEVALLDARMGRMNLNRLVPADALATVNIDIKRLLVDRVGSQGLHVAGVESDNHTLRLYLSREL